MTKSWHTGLVGLFMLAIGTLSTWAFQQRITIYSPAPSLQEKILIFFLLGFVIFMGLWSLVIVASKWNDDHAFVPGFLLAYRDAWRGFTRQKWLRILVYSVAAVNILGAVTEFALQRYYLGEYIEKMSRGQGLFGMLSRFQDSPGVPPIAAVLNNLFKSLPGTINGTLVHFMPDPVFSSSSGASGFLALCVLAFLPWISKRLASLQDGSPHASEINFFRRLILPVGIMALLVAIGQFYALWHQYTGIAASYASYASHSGGQPETFIQGWLLVTATILSEVFHAGIVVPLLVGGLAGSLQRAAYGSPATDESFLEDSIRTFRPIAGIFLLFLLVPTLFEIPSLVAWATNSSYNPSNFWYTNLQSWFWLAWKPLTLILMFAPYVVATSRVTMWRGLRDSLRAWLNCGYNLLSFVAFGIAALTVILSIPTLLYSLAGTFPTPASLLPSLIVLVISNVVKVVLAIVMAVAVWQFYQQIRTESVADEK